MLVRPRRAAAFVVGAALLALAAACTNPTAPAATPNHARVGISADGVDVGGSTQATTSAPGGVDVGGST